VLFCRGVEHCMVKKGKVRSLGHVWGYLSARASLVRPVIICDGTYIEDQGEWMREGELER
jgi:hypothetical protein